MSRSATPGWLTRRRRDALPDYVAPIDRTPIFDHSAQGSAHESVQLVGVSRKSAKIGSPSSTHIELCASPPRLHSSSFLRTCAGRHDNAVRVSSTTARSPPVRGAPRIHNRTASTVNVFGPSQRLWPLPDLSGRPSFFPLPPARLSRHNLISPRARCWASISFFSLRAATCFFSASRRSTDLTRATSFGLATPRLLCLGATAVTGASRACGPTRYMGIGRDDSDRRIPISRRGAAVGLAAEVRARLCTGLVARRRVFIPLGRAEPAKIQG